MSIFSHGKLITILQYFTDRVEDYWHILYPVADPLKREQDRYLYFYNISRKALDYDGEFSKEGLYLFKGYDGEYHLHSLELAQYALACWLAWQKTEDEIWLEKAMLHCDWLVEHQEVDGAWRTTHKNPIYSDLPTPWPSALTQGLGISSLLRAYYYTKNKIYLSSAKKACDFLEKSVEVQGIRRKFEKNSINGFIYEEYPRKELNGVLNGYISVLLAIYELNNITHKHKEMFRKNMDNLKEIIPLYDSGYWSYYSLDGNLSSGFYHRLIVKQLKILSELDTEFEQYYKVHLKYQNNKIYAFKALLLKIKSRL